MASWEILGKNTPWNSLRSTNFPDEYSWEVGRNDFGRAGVAVSPLTSLHMYIP